MAEIEIGDSFEVTTFEHYKNMMDHYPLPDVKNIYVKDDLGQGSIKIQETDNNGEGEFHNVSKSQLEKCLAGNYISRV